MGSSLPQPLIKVDCSWHKTNGDKDVCDSNLCLSENLRSWLNLSLQEYVVFCNMEINVAQRGDLNVCFGVTQTQEGTLIVQYTITGKPPNVTEPHHCLQIRSSHMTYIITVAIKRNNRNDHMELYPI